MSVPGCDACRESTSGSCPLHPRVWRSKVGSDRREAEPAPGVVDVMRLGGLLPLLGPDERDCPTCAGTGINPVVQSLVCPKCNGERKVPK